MQSLILRGNRSSKVTKKSGNSVSANDEDRISELPESIISQILSSMPTKDAVRTSVLSKDWENKWHSVYNISLDDRQRFSRRRSNKAAFMSFVDRLFFLTDELRSFRLSCLYNYDNRYLGWISAALKGNIECFEFEALESKGFVLPRNLLSKTSLRILKLKAPCTFKVPRNDYFRNLTYLHLKRVRIQNIFPNTYPLVFTFPVLKTFELIECSWLDTSLVEIHSPTLSTFGCETDMRAGASGYTIKICGATLERFESAGGFPEKIILCESTVLTAVMRNYPWRKFNEEEIDLHAQNLLKWFSTATSLYLSDWTCQVLAKQELQLPQYDRLQRLVGCFWWRDNKLLFKLLHSAPSLKHLRLLGNGEEFEYDEVDSVPHCVTSSLEEVEFITFREQSLFHLALFFLKNGVELKKVYITNLWSREFSLAEQILTYPTASGCVEIVRRNGVRVFSILPGKFISISVETMS